MPTQQSLDATGPGGPDHGAWIDVLLPLASRWKWLLFAPMLATVLALGVCLILPKSYTSRTLFLPPQQQQSQSAALSALTQLGALSGLAGAAGIKNQADQYVALLQSTTVADRLIDQFKLMEVYDVSFRYKARRELSENVRILLGRKDGLIAVEVEDRSPQRAAQMANQHIEELRRLTSTLVLTEAQRRRVSFEKQLAQTRDNLTLAQKALQASGFSQSALRADARASAEGYARVRAESTAAEVRLHVMRQRFADDTPEVQQALAALAALQSQLRKQEASTDLAGSTDYVSKFREFKYHETLFELLARQYELARLDESREGTLIQVIDEAKPAERHSWPKYWLFGGVAYVASLLLVAIVILLRFTWAQASQRPETAVKLAELRRNWSGPSR